MGKKCLQGKKASKKRHEELRKRCFDRERMGDEARWSEERKVAGITKKEARKK
jgi:hypothetical protein